MTGLDEPLFFDDKKARLVKHGKTIDVVIGLFKGNEDEALSLFADVPLSDLKYAGVRSPDQLGEKEKIVLLYTDKEHFLLRVDPYRKSIVQNMIDYY